MSKQKLTPAEAEEILTVLKARFEKNKTRHAALNWDAVAEKLKDNPGKLWSLSEMERTEGEPEVVGYDQESDTYLFYDCAAESPKGRRSLCYDRKALDARKANKPDNSAIDLADAMGVTLLTTEEYAYLQTLGQFDLKTSSWVMTPPEIRKLGGAIFCDRRYNQVFTYHNGADSYYGARGFRVVLRV
ncbi:DUF4256 domain-containing protein [Sphingobacterium oryzagri]|uniref:DUF4256 domain-containing protein n=1 Tax=Sphingobacterium oryzagri TaxID=3025669 RepID=A0ABY7WGM0_9SPHI|nr:DUF4256 domain-containing protein [Sphingobacterium sp. KACC 22765]WDF68630.1 DUF4256 domain-containing protein [Sphingobacterium sp. KACC 22765]